MDNCPDVANTDQLDGLFGLGDGVGDACDDDDDNDGDYKDVALFAWGEPLAMPSLANRQPQAQPTISTRRYP